MLCAGTHSGTLCVPSGLVYLDQIPIRSWKATLKSYCIGFLANLENASA